MKPKFKYYRVKLKSINLSCIDEKPTTRGEDYTFIATSPEEALGFAAKETLSGYYGSGWMIESYSIEKIKLPIDSEPK